MMKRFLCLIFASCLLSLASAQTYVELILDASGSMWNKLADGEYRIIAAKDVLSGFVNSLPADPDLNVGLRVYGSRILALDEGACEDSELFVPIEGISRNELLGIVRDTEATGATPIAYSLQLAGQDFPAEGNKVIILVTDGEESCGGDVRGTIEALKDQGIEFELKIIGFDLDDRAIQSFEGLGTFENAKSAEELASALGRAVEVEQTETYPVTVFVTRVGEPAADGAAVSFTNAVSNENFNFIASEPGMLTANLPAGAYVASVEDAFTDAVQNFSDLSINPDRENTFSFELTVENEVILTVIPIDPVTGSTVTVSYEGAPEGEGNWITIVPADLPDHIYLRYKYVTNDSGNIELQIPGELVSLEARYHLDLPEGGSRVIGRSEAFTPIQATAKLTVPTEVAAGTAFEVGWTGPNNQRDYLTVVIADAADGKYGEYHYTKDGSPLNFTSPIEPGSYEVRYQSDGTTGVIAKQAFTVVASEITLTIPTEVEAGKLFEASWTGPDGKRDYLTIVSITEADGKYGEYHYTRDGSSLTFTAPIEPGEYELRYQSDREAGVFARKAFTVMGTEITLEAPESVMAGSPFEVSWVGPDGKQDYITIVPASAEAGKYKSYKYTKGGSPVNLVAGVEAGEYEVRYQSDRESGVVFASTPITVMVMEIVLEAPPEVTAGESFDVNWTGPGGPQDYITIVSVGANEGAYLNYQYVKRGNPISLKAPDEAGNYEIRYQTDADGVFARIPIIVR